MRKLYARPPDYADNARDPSPSQAQLDRACGVNTVPVYQGTGHADPGRAGSPRRTLNIPSVAQRRICVNLDGG